jgi:hypothetical protein
MIAMDQDWRRQYDLHMLGPPGTSLVTVRSAHAKFNDVCQLLLDLQPLVLNFGPSSVISPGNSPSGPVSAFAAFPPASVSSKSYLPRSERQSSASAGSGVVLSSRGPGSFNSPRFWGRVIFQKGDLDHFWYCAGMLKTARTLSLMQLRNTLLQLLPALLTIPFVPVGSSRLICLILPKRSSNLFVLLVLLMLLWILPLRLTLIILVVLILWILERWCL